MDTMTGSEVLEDIGRQVQGAEWADLGGGFAGIMATRGNREIIITPYTDSADPDADVLPECTHDHLTARVWADLAVGFYADGNHIRTGGMRSTFRAAIAANEWLSGRITN